MFPRKSFISLLVLVLLTSWGAPSLAAQPRIGLVLSGGGARGAAHIGVLKVMEELRVPVHVIAGTSMGSLVGGAYASGLNAEMLEQSVGGIDWNDLLSDDPPRGEWPVRRKQASETPTWDFSIGRRDGEFNLPKGALAGQKVQLYFSELVRNSERVENFDALPIPFRAVATNLENGAVVVFKDGSLPFAMRASMAVPGLFSPMESEEGLYVDGGLVRNLPVDVARAMGADVIIAVNLGTTYLPREKLGTVLGVTGQMLTILTEQNVQASLTQLNPRRDVLIKPELGDITAGDFKRSAEAIAIGEKAAREMASELSRYRLSEAEYAAWRSGVDERARTPAGFIDEVRVTGPENVSPEVFDKLKDHHSGAPLDREALEKDIQSVYAGGDFERISYRFERENGRNLLIVDALEKAWGPGYLSFGLGAATDFQGDSRMGIRGLYRETWVNALGAEWLTELTVGNEASFSTEFYQPLSLDRSAFVAPYLSASSIPMSLYRGDDRIARYDVSRLRAGGDLGTTFGNAAEMRIGVYAGSTDASVDTGDPLLPEGWLTDSGVRASFVYDTLDSGFVPTDGQRLAVEVVHPLPEFGADVDYTSLSASWAGAWHRDAHTIIGLVRGGTSFDEPMPYYDQFALGGFLKLSGYANEQFRGNAYAFGGVGYYHRIAELTPPLGRGIYAGASLEAGRIFDTEVMDTSLGDDPLGVGDKTRYSGSLFLAADTWLGPFYLGWGLSGEGDSSFHLLLGRP